MSKFPCARCLYSVRAFKVPRLLLQNQMGLHEELDPQPEPTGCQIIHLLADAVPQIQPQVFSFAACELQPKVVYFDYAQLSANLKKDETSRGGVSQKTHTRSET